MKPTIILLQPMSALHARTLGGVIMAARAREEVAKICDETYGTPDQDWSVDIDSQQGIVVSFKDPNQAMRFKLAWNPS